MTAEKRQSSRSSFFADDPDYSFYLEERGRQHEINTIQDVSISGLGLGLPKPLNIGDKVALKYDSDDYNLSISATIIWCNNVPGDQPFRLGIEFDRENKEDNALFFLAVRKYLDPFDGKSASSS